MGLEIVRPTNGEFTCTSSKDGTLIDYVVITQGYRSFIGSCETVIEVPCGTHLGVRTTLAPSPADIEFQTLREPKNLLTPGRQVPSWDEAYQKTKRRAKAHVMGNRVAAIDDYVRELGIEDDALAVAIAYARWSAAAEYRLLAAAGIHVDDISWKDLEPFLGRGRMPVLETVTLSDLLDYTKQDLELVAWTQGQDDAFGCDRFLAC